MFYIVESESQLQRLTEEVNSTIFLKLFTTSPFFHPRFNQPVAAYIKNVEDGKGYIIPINHPEGINVSIDRVEQYLKNINEIFVLDKKELFYSSVLNNTTDLKLLGNSHNHIIPEYPSLPKITSRLYNQHKDLPYLNKLVPLSKLFEEAELVYDTYQDLISLEKDESFTFYNSTFVKVFFLLEQV